ncbi:hypothetical protein CABS01_16603, partial [Colletotrichum abscissum]|uniref:uncharacterized protein n=1 Tax=Colletotrichum abscissum TaxID=1671311 RepID=UPI0027D74BFB
LCANGHASAHPRHRDRLPLSSIATASQQAPHEAMGVTICDAGALWKAWSRRARDTQPPPKRLCDASVQSFPAQRHHAPRFGSAKQLGAFSTVRTLFFFPFLLLARCSYPAARKALNCWLRGTQKQPRAKSLWSPSQPLCPVGKTGSGGSSS